MLYTNLQHSPAEDSLADSFRGLGQVDSRKDTLPIIFELKNTTLASDPSLKQSKRKARDRDKTIEIELAQDKTALRSRKGDTGSVLWWARFVVLAWYYLIFRDVIFGSVAFAQLVLQQYHSHVEDPLLNSKELAKAHILELGFALSLFNLPPVS